MEFNNEIWVEVDGFPNYEVSNYGRIWSRYSHKMLKPILSGSGGCKVSLWRYNTRTVFAIHRVVADNFMSNFSKSMYVRHLDGDKTNNHISNLAPIDAEKTQKALEIASEVTWAQKVRVIEWDEVYPSTVLLAIELDTAPSNIYKCLRGERKHHLGLSFEYV